MMRCTPEQKPLHQFGSRQACHATEWPRSFKLSQHKLMYQRQAGDLLFFQSLSHRSAAGIEACQVQML